jgi:hypothetical protein|tara:strand:+ start:480 stop:1022 length:543 start_codon:yes stop_codon:yes gene_type:complete
MGACFSSDQKYHVRKVVYPVTKEDVKEAQDAWAAAIVEISRSHADKEDYVGLAVAKAEQLYGYGYGQVLFKPTKAADAPFRPLVMDAYSYFVGCNAPGVKNGYKEDKGFAINGGDGWSKVKFDNHDIACYGEVAIAMGTYYFTSAKDKSVAKVEYTFGYKRCGDGKVRICLHHSSVPYKA